MRRRRRCRVVKHGLFPTLPVSEILIGQVHEVLAAGETTAGA